MERNNEVDIAFDVAKAIEWEGDMRVNFHTCHTACVVLARYVESLEGEVANLRDQLEDKQWS